jgi:hypothetical protein
MPAEELAVLPNDAMNFGVKWAGQRHDRTRVERLKTALKWLFKESRMNVNLRLCQRLPRRIHARAAMHDEQRPNVRDGRRFGRSRSLPTARGCISDSASAFVTPKKSCWSGPCITHLKW